jgi:predicted dehydrogenase
VKRVAIIGCGAITESFHLPGLLQQLGGPDGVVLVDPDVERARALGRTHGISEAVAGHDELPGRVDGAIIASPHHTHVPIALDLVDEGIPVLCEKPLGTDVAEVEELRERAASRGVVVAVNQTRRFIPAVREVGRILAAGELGGPVSLDANEGDVFGWPAATPSMFGARSGGRGLLLDIGAHVLDLLVLWFGPDLELVSYRDDSFGGSEASVLVEVAGPGMEARVRLSWLAKQRNDYRFEGPDGALVWGVYDLDAVRLERPGGGGRERRVPAPGAYTDLAPLVLEDFFRAVAGKVPPAAGPDDVLPSMRLMEACYSARTRFDMPWHAFEMETAHGA